MLQRNDFSSLFSFESIIAGIIFFLIMSYLVFVLIYRRAGAKRPLGRPERTFLESTYAVLVLFLAIGLIVRSTTMNDNETRPQHANMVVNVVGFQWCWRFTYPEYHIQVVGHCGLKRAFPTLVIPTHENVRFEITSTDVVHEFWIPHLRYKREALPGWVNSFVVTMDSPGRWVGRCSEFCGLYHSYMHLWLQAVPQPVFKRWVAAHSHSIIATA